MSHPKDMDGYIAAASHALDTVQKLVPKRILKNCAGVILLSSQEFGIAVSMQTGNGVLLSHSNGDWSPPVAVRLGSMGFGATFGMAHKEMCIVLNRFAMQSLLENEDGHLEFGADLGFAWGKSGVTAGADVDFGGGMATSFVYTFEKGVMITAQLERGNITTVKEVNMAFYGTTQPSEIMERKVAVPESAAVTELVKKIGLITDGTSTTTTTTTSAVKDDTATTTVAPA